MKRVLALILTVSMAIVSCKKEGSNDEPYNPDGSPITQAQALEIVKEDIDQYDLVYVSKTIVKKGTRFQTYYDRYGTVPRESWVVFMNTNPNANSGPYWLYIYVDPYSGNADRDSWEWGYPDTFEYDLIKYELPSLSKETISPSLHLLTRHASVTSYPSNNWAVIISGEYRPDVNWERY